MVPAVPASAVAVRSTKTDSRLPAVELRMEIAAAGHDMQAVAREIHDALESRNELLALHHAGRLWMLGGDYIKRGAA